MENLFGKYQVKMNHVGLNLRRRFALYVACAVIFLVMLLLILLSVFGVLNPTYSKIESYLDNHLETIALRFEHDIEKLAAYSLSFSGQMQEFTENFLNKRSMTFEELNNNIDAITAFQKESYSEVYTNIRIAPCSGAFYILNTTVNDRLDTPHYSCVYLRFANLYSENTPNTNVSLFRGGVEVARDKNINLFSTWHYEALTNAFESTSDFETQKYALSEVVDIPETWERARYVYSPIYDNKGEVIGICGYEISDLYLQLAYSFSDTQSRQSVCALLDKVEGGYKGQFISNISGVSAPKCESVSVKTHDRFNGYLCGNYVYIGKETQIDIQGKMLNIAVMLPKNQLDKAVHSGRLKYMAIFFIIAITSYIVCVSLSKTYIDPIRKSIVQIKANKKSFAPSGIAEIDDLFAFIAEQDRKIEAALAEMEAQKIQMQSTLEQVSNENNSVKKEIARLAYSRKNEVDPDDYENFRNGIKTLTKMERKVFDCYIEGMKIKEIVEHLGVKESTVRFHNRNIYSKLGVNSLKQLLMYAAIMKSDGQ